jgi:4-hydroxybenzoate polyprenyltransferase
MGSIQTYIRERFPLPLVVLLTVGYGIFIVGISSRGVLLENKIIVTALVMLAFFAFLLRQRVTDEFKDLRHDTKNYPNRPLQRGIVTKRQLVWLGACALTLEAVSVITISIITDTPLSLAVYCGVFFYSALMSVEFFMSEWLEKHFTLYFLLHQFIFMWLITWNFSIFNTPVNLFVLGSAVSFILSLSSIEIIRKFEVRHNSNGAVVADTYPSVWGRTATILTLVLITAVGAGLLSVALHSWLPALSWMVIAAFISRFSRSDTMIRLLVALLFILQSIWAFIL